MKLVIYLLLFTSTCFSQGIRVDHNTRSKKDAHGNTYVYETIIDTVIVRPNYTGFFNDMQTSDVYQSIKNNLTPNDFTLFVVCMNSGCDMSSFSKILDVISQNLTKDEKEEFNSILTKNYFAIQL